MHEGLAVCEARLLWGAAVAILAYMLRRLPGRGGLVAAMALGVALSGLAVWVLRCLLAG